VDEADREGCARYSASSVFVELEVREVVLVQVMFEAMVTRSVSVVD